MSPLCVASCLNGTQVHQSCGGRLNSFLSFFLSFVFLFFLNILFSPSVFALLQFGRFMKLLSDLLKFVEEQQANKLKSLEEMNKEASDTVHLAKVFFFKKKK